MPIYTPPLRDQQFVMHEVLHAVDDLRQMKPYADIEADTVNHVVEEAGKFCAKELLPINRSGDEEGCTYDPKTHAVKVPQGFADAYAHYCSGGWGSLSCEPEFGGQGLPQMLQIAFYEMQYSANEAWAMYPGLTHGAYECLLAHASDELKATYLPKLVSGEWMGTMCLTEAHCGTDLGMLRTRAEPQADGSYRLTGNKIFISGGESDIAENIIHLVLARLPDAPKGTKGISLFVVPKFVPDGRGEAAKVGARNGIYCGGIEHKMGIHGNATCQMVLEGATGWMVGEPNKGLNAMFVMMNGARLGVGVQGLGLTEVAYQNAVAYARDRLQGRSLAGPKAPDKPADPIIVHPDVRRMLLTARAFAEGGRAFAYWVALQADHQHYHPDAEQRQFGADMMALMTPIVKAFMTDNGYRCATECQQVFGGHGYIREWGMEQFVRDARINMIYEGTNTIQSLDLLGRKILGDNGAKLKKFGRLVQEFVEANGTRADMSEFVTPLADLGDKVTKLTMEIAMKAMGNPEEAGAAAVDYLRVVGHLVYAYFWARMAAVALDRIGADGANVDPFYRAKVATARFYFQRLLPETAFHIRAARSGAANLMQFETDHF
ncbi:MAG TPA: acyl-CoA dehydrogenase C-terminal domain-containing protein, partial [Burkholderiaceae bacterium]|nr:acyl-CoA dehydrogenase C-terminal domain-containing protein [Burkholderiaceae bacterium]